MSSFSVQRMLQSQRSVLRPLLQRDLVESEPEDVTSGSWIAERLRSWQYAEPVDEVNPPEPPPEPVTLEVGDVRPQPRTEARHLWAQELVRAGLAGAFFLLLAATIIWALFQVGSTSTWTNAKEALQILLPVETTLVGASTAFYYRSRRD